MAVLSRIKPLYGNVGNPTGGTRAFTTACCAVHILCACYKHPVIPPEPVSRVAAIAPVIIAAACFAFADVATKVTLHAGADVLTMALFRGMIGVPLLLAWVFVGAAPKPLTTPQRRLALLIGLLFAGNVFFLFKAIEVMEVPLAILTYFTYPLLTGLAAAATGIERLGLAGALAALAAFAGLALMIGAHPGGVALAGIAFALLSSCTRVVILLLTRAKLQGADSRLITLWSLIAATVVFVAAAFATMNWQPPVTAAGWFALIASSIAMAIAVLMIFVSTARIGPFRTALFMNFEPLLATIASGIVLGEVITPLQALGGAVMVAALVAFQMRR
ncbi:MAG: EamA family transporter [Rhizobiales bacterium]|nr:EamA family transporter [Hyphomicrobiales bacterium]